nr:protein DEK-like isoform X2 [Ipomoea trifida]
MKFQVHCFGKHKDFAFPLFGIDIAIVAYKLSKRKPDDNLQILHSILYGKKTKVHNLKRNIGQFSGYVWVENEHEKQRVKVREKLEKCVKEKLLDFCDVLNVPVNRASEELTVKLLEFLESPHATTDLLLANKEKVSLNLLASLLLFEGTCAFLSNSKKQKGKATETKSSMDKAVSKQAKKQKTQVGEKRKRSSKLHDEEADSELSGSSDESQDEDNNDEAAPGGSDQEGSDSKKRSADSTTKPEKESSKRKKVEGDSGKEKNTSSKEKATGKKQSEKSSTKASEKEAVKPKSRQKSKPEPSKEEMHAVVVNILKGVDFNTVSTVFLFFLLCLLNPFLPVLLTASLTGLTIGSHFGVDLMHRKSEVKDIIAELNIVGFSVQGLLLPVSVSIDCINRKLIQMVTLNRFSSWNRPRMVAFL